MLEPEPVPGDTQQLSRSHHSDYAGLRAQDNVSSMSSDCHRHAPAERETAIVIAFAQMMVDLFQSK